RTVHVFHVEFGGGGSHFTQARDPARNLVDIGHREFHTGFLGSSQQVQHGVGGTAHSHVQGHGVFKSLIGGDVAWQDRFVVLLVVALGQIHDQAASALEQTLATGVGGNNGAVTGQGQAQSLGQAVHGVGSKHARTGATGRTSAALNGF